MNAQVKSQSPVRVLDDVVIEQFNESNVSLISKELEKQLALISAKFGITLTSSVGKTTTNSLSIRVSGYITSETEGGVKPQWKATYMRLCHLLGLTPDDFGRYVYNLNLKHPEKESYEIVGMTPKSLDLIIRTPTDKFYRLPLEESRFAEHAPVIEPVDESPASIEAVIEEVLTPELKDHELTEIQELEFDTDSLADLDLDYVTADLD